MARVFTWLSGFLVALAVSFSGAAAAELRVYFLDVGQGDATLLAAPRCTVLIDAGRHDRSDVVPHLDDVGVEAIDLLINVGVATAHDDPRGRLKMAGVRRTLVAAGPQKVDVNPWQPLGVDGDLALQARVNELYALFVRHVARGRGVPEATVRRDYGQGRFLAARCAVEAGMADAVGTLDDVLADPETGRRSAAAAKAQRFRRVFAG